MPWRKFSLCFFLLADVSTQENLSAFSPDHPLAASSVLDAQGASTAESELGVNLRLYNYARIDEAALGRAGSVTTTILEQAGLGTTWLSCAVTRIEAGKEPACGASFLANDIVVKLVSRSMATKLNRRPGTYGFAIPTPGRGVGTVFVFVHRADELARYGSFPVHREIVAPVILGHLIAHEIGHLLLGIDSHSTAGIMSSPWSRPVLQRLSQGGLFFTSAEVRLIHEGIAPIRDPGGGPDVIARSRPD